MTTYGQIYFSHEFVAGQDVDVALTGGLISAIYSMTAETQREKISEMDLEQNKIIFRELKDNLLFILTVDKRMDEKDANGLLTALADRFFERYEGRQIEGMILSDFEPDVLEITSDRIWYANAPRMPKPLDWVAMLVTSMCIWYYGWLLAGFGSLITDEILDSTGDGIWSFLWTSLVSGAYILIPGAIAGVSISYSEYVRASYRFAMEFWRRPTRASYVELFPKILMAPIFFAVVAGASWTWNFGVFYHELSFDPLIESYKTSASGYVPLERSLFGLIKWQESYYFDAAFMGILALLVWIFVFPIVLQVVLGEPEFYWKAVFIVAVSAHILAFAMLLGSCEFAQIVGLHPSDTEMFSSETRTLRFLFVNQLPLNITFFAFFLVMGMGLARLPKGKGQRIPFILAFAASAMLILVIHRFLQYYLDSQMWA